MPNGTIIYPTKGTPQGGIISPLLANIVLNELDCWIESQWQNNPVARHYSIGINKNGSVNLGNGYRGMKNTNLKEMFIVRYADDFRVLCRNKTAAERTKIAITQWLWERLRLEVSEEKTRIINVKRRYSDFLGFKIKVYSKGKNQVVKSHMSDKQFNSQTMSLVEQAKRIAKPQQGKTEVDEIHLFNSMVMGIQNYYSISTCICIDARKIHRRVMTVLTNRLGLQTGSRLRKDGRNLTENEQERYGKSKMLRYVTGSEEPIYPIGYVHFRCPMAKKRNECRYTADGRKGMHENLRINTRLMLSLMEKPLPHESVEYCDNRISLFSAQWGKCAITGKEFYSTDEIHCHHKVPRSKGGTDRYDNLILVLKPVHILIHAKDKSVIIRYLNILNLKPKQLEKINELRHMVGLGIID